MTCEVSVNLIEEGKKALEVRDMELATCNFSRAIIEENYEDSEYWCLLAESLFYQTKFEDSLECWKEAARIDPTNKKIWIKISAIHALLEEDELATYFYEISENLPIE